MRIRLSDRIKAFFASDEEAFWFNHFTDEEKALGSMDVWDLAKVINEAGVRNLAGEARKLIVAEHMLNVRLARIQSKASWGAGILGFSGAIIGAAISITLAPMFQNQNEVQYNQENTRGKQAVHAPEKKTLAPIAKPAKSTPGNSSTNIPVIKETIKDNPPNTETNQKKNAPANP